MAGAVGGCICLRAEASLRDPLQGEGYDLSKAVQQFRWAAELSTVRTPDWSDRWLVRHSRAMLVPTYAIDCSLYARRASHRMYLYLY